MMVPVCTPCRGSGLVSVVPWFRWSGLVWRPVPWSGLAVDLDSLQTCYAYYKTVTVSSGRLTISDGARWR
jgi:hypothetical protein